MGGKRNKALFICLIILVAVVYANATAVAQEPSFRLDLDNLNLQIGVSTRLTLSMINAQGAEVVEIEGLAALMASRAAKVRQSALSTAEARISLIGLYHSAERSWELP